MTHLYKLVQRNVAAWRADGYPAEGYPAIAEVLEYATLPEGGGLHFLRAAQLRARKSWSPKLYDISAALHRR